MNNQYQNDNPPVWWWISMLSGVGILILACLLFIPGSIGQCHELHPSLLVCMNPIRLRGLHLVLWMLHWVSLLFLITPLVGSILAIVMEIREKDQSGV